MKASNSELQQLKGVGEILSKRFIEAGLDSCEKIAEAGLEGLKQIKGLNPRILNSLLEQARQMTSVAAVDKEGRVNNLKQSIVGLRDTVQSFVAATRERFQDELAGKRGKKLTKDLMGILNTLDGIEQKLPKRLKRAGKGLLKAESLLAGVAESPLPKVSKGLKKARKSLKRVLS